MRAWRAIGAAALAGTARSPADPRASRATIHLNSSELMAIDTSAAAISVSSAIRGSTPSATASVPRERELADLRRARIDAVSTCQAASDVSATFAQSAAADVANAATNIAIALRIADRS
jgi:hypothetical protein